MKPPQLLEHWYKTTDWILDKCDRFPKQTRFTIAGRMADLAITTLELITEAAYSKEKRALLTTVNLNLEKLRLLFRLCFDRHYISPSQYEFIQSEINTAGRMCGGWLKSCNA
ncbi:MAG: diversity-generating retroelement protein Avd [Saprospirales bacterium]|nr:diversity-generating retroelement protein Avd [Saprospirales bacterium]